LLTACLLLPLVAASIVTTSRGVGGERVGSVYIMKNSTGYLVEAQYILGTLVICWILVSRFHWTSFLGVVGYVGYRAWFGYSRFTILLFGVSVLVLLAWRQQRKWPPWWTMAVGVPILLLFHVLGAQRELIKHVFRGESFRIVRSEDWLTARDRIKSEMDGPDFANFDFLAFSSRLSLNEPKRSPTAANTYSFSPNLFRGVYGRPSLWGPRSRGST
jgi:hypothetical protein